MRILVLSNIELDAANAAGNTFANWLSGWDDTEITSLYCRSSIPHNDFCDSFYSISPIEIIKNALTPWKIGHFYKKEDIKKKECKKNKIEYSLIKKTKKRNFSFFHVMNDMIINTKLWQNEKYKNYILGFNPEIVFCFAKSEAFIYQNLKYIKRYTDAKIVLFFADDMYSIYRGFGLKNLIFRHRFPKIARMGDLNYGASCLMCKDYSKEFGISLTPLYKGCIISEVKEEIHHPIKIVYAGNLYYGREETLYKIASAIKQLNKDSQQIRLEIYTSAEITEEINKNLNIEETSQIVGMKPYEEIKQIMHNADIVLHVESFLPKNIKKVRLSYSTKISDCLQSGSTMLVVGPRGIASVEETILMDGVKVICDTQNIERELKILCNPQQLVERAKKTNAFAKKKFLLGIVRKNLQNDFFKLIKL